MPMTSGATARRFASGTFTNRECAILEHALRLAYQSYFEQLKGCDEEGAKQLKINCDLSEKLKQLFSNILKQNLGEQDEQA